MSKKLKSYQSSINTLSMWDKRIGIHKKLTYIVGLGDRTKFSVIRKIDKNRGQRFSKNDLISIPELIIENKLFPIDTYQELKILKNK